MAISSSSDTLLVTASPAGPVLSVPKGASLVPVPPVSVLPTGSSSINEGSLGLSSVSPQEANKHKVKQATKQSLKQKLNEGVLKKRNLFMVTD